MLNTHILPNLGKFQLVVLIKLENLKVDLLIVRGFALLAVATEII